MAMSAAGVAAIVMMTAACVSVLVVMGVALEVGAGRERSGEIRLDSRFRAAGDATYHFDTRLGKRGHRVAAETIANAAKDAGATLVGEILKLDDTNEADQTDGKIADWVQTIKV